MLCLYFSDILTIRKLTNHIVYSESIQENRAERLTEDLSNVTQVEKLRLKGNVLEKNLSPSLQNK